MKQLRITTDEGAASGTAGAVYSYALRGGGLALVPEPATLASLGLTALILRRRR